MIFSGKSFRVLIFGSAISVLSNSPEQLGFSWCTVTDSVGNWVPAASGRDAYLVSGFIIKELIQSCLIVSSVTIGGILVGATAKMAQ